MNVIVPINKIGRIKINNTTNLTRTKINKFHNSSLGWTG